MEIQSTIDSVSKASIINEAIDELGRMYREEYWKITEGTSTQITEFYLEKHFYEDIINTSIVADSRKNRKLQNK